VSTPDVEEYRAEHAGEPEQIGFSEDELALEFTRRYRDELLYVDEWNRWPRWDGARWRADRTREVYDLARRVCRRAAEFATTETERKRLRSAQTVAAVVKLACADRDHARVTEDWDSDPWLLNTPDGTNDLRSGASREHRRSDMITRVTSVAPGGSCPLWLASLERWTDGDEELVGFLRRFVGYALTGETREHVFGFSHGVGANGKSTFHGLLTYALGDYAAVAPVETFTEAHTDRHPTELAMLRGARLVVATETTEGRRWDETRIKTLTGGDPVSARFMRRDFFTFTPQFKLLISGNHKPGLRSVDEAIRRRLLLVPWSVTIPPRERDPELSEKLRAEAPGILAWAIVGCLEWQDVGLKPPARVLEATESYFAEQDSVARWIEDRLVVARNASATLTALYRDWQEWARDAGEYVHSQAAVLERLRERLGDQIDDARLGKRRDRALLGVGLATDTEAEK